MSENIRLIDSENEKTLGVSGDVLPSAHKYATFFKKYLRKRMRQSGFRRITTSGIEPVGIGESVLNKENICTISKTQALRSCSPTSIMRSYLENDMKEWVQPVQLYHLQEMFRKEGDMISSYYEYGFEIIGQKDPVIAAEWMSVLYKIYQDLGIAENIQFVIHSLGDDKSKEKYRLALMNYYTGKERNLCDDCRKSLEEESPFSLLTCAEEDCKILSDLAPLSDSYINKKSKDHYQKVKDFLDIMELPYVSEGVPSVSLENHNDIVFSVKYTSGDMSVLLGTGGRHDSLSQKMGSTKEIPAFGFSWSIDVLMDIIHAQDILVEDKDDIHVLLVTLWENAKKKAFALMNDMRDSGIKTVMSLGSGPLKSQLLVAERYQAQYAVILGEMEIIEGNALIRDMKDNSQERIVFEEILPFFTDKFIN